MFTGEWILGLLNIALWYFGALMLVLLDAVGECMEWLSSELLEYILFGGKVNSFDQVLIPDTYIRMAIVGGAVWGVIFIISLINFYRKDIMEHDETTMGKWFKDSIKFSSFGFAMVIFMPMLMWILIKMTSVLNILVLLAFGASENATLGQSLYNIGNPNPIEITADINYFDMPSNIMEWNMLVQILGLVVTLLCCVLILVQLVVTLFTMYFYFILTSIFSLLAVIDEGKRMKEYAQTMIASNLIVCSALLIFNIFGSLLQVALAAMRRTNMGTWASVLLSLILAIGGALFAVKGNEYVTRIVGQDIPGVSSAMSNFGMLAAGIGFTGMLAKSAMNLGFGKKVGSGGLSNKVGNLLGGDSNNAGVQNQESNISPTSAEGITRAGEDVKAKKRNAVTGRSGGTFGLVGKTLGSVSKTLNFAKNSVGAMFGHKPSRQAVKDSMKAGTNSIKNVGRKVAGGAAFLGGALGIQQTIGAIKSSNSRAKNFKKINKDFSRISTLRGQKIKILESKGKLNKASKMQNNLNKKAHKISYWENSNTVDKLVNQLGQSKNEIERGMLMEVIERKHRERIGDLIYLKKNKQIKKVEKKFKKKYKY